MRRRTYRKHVYGSLHDPNRCVYCRIPFSEDDGYFELDHFPVPYGCGGSEVVAACFDCHTVKDRLGIEKWAPIFQAGLIELFGNVESFDVSKPPWTPFSPEAVINLAGDIIPKWAEFSFCGRLVWARLRAMAERERQLYPVVSN